MVRLNEDSLSPSGVLIHCSRAGLVSYLFYPFLSFLLCFLISAFVCWLLFGLPLFLFPPFVQSFLFTFFIFSRFALVPYSFDLRVSSSRLRRSDSLVSMELFELIKKWRVTAVKLKHSYFLDSLLFWHLTSMPLPRLSPEGTPKLIPEEGSTYYLRVQHYRELLDSLQMDAYTHGCILHPEITVDSHIPAYAATCIRSKTCSHPSMLWESIMKTVQIISKCSGYSSSVHSCLIFLRCVFAVFLCDSTDRKHTNWAEETGRTEPGA